MPVRTTAKARRSSGDTASTLESNSNDRSMLSGLCAAAVESRLQGPQNEPSWARSCCAEFGVVRLVRKVAVRVHEAWGPLRPLAARRSEEDPSRRTRVAECNRMWKVAADPFAVAPRCRAQRGGVDV